MGHSQKSKNLVKTINISLYTRNLKKKIPLTPIITVMDLKEDIVISLSCMSASLRIGRS
jgi:hypothetical protein